nr:hypothetical protein [Angustibacter aerolatus]
MVQAVTSSRSGRRAGRRRAHEGGRRGGDGAPAPVRVDAGRRGDVRRAAHVGHADHDRADRDVGGVDQAAGQRPGRRARPGSGLGVPAYDVQQTGYPSRMREWTSKQRREGLA